MTDFQDKVATSRPWIKETIEVLNSADGNIYFIPPTGDSDFHLLGPTDVDRALLASMNGRNTGASIASTITERYPSLKPGEVLASIAEFAEAGLLADAGAPTHLPERIANRYDRQLAYLQDLVAYGLSAQQLQVRLQDSHVAVLGVGGVGSMTALAISGIGVGALTLVDGDRVELSNLHRQWLFTEGDIGKPKASTARLRLLERNSDCKVTAVDCYLDSPTAVDRVISSADLVIASADTPVGDISHWIAEACNRQLIPCLTMSQVPPLVRIGPLLHPDSPGCWNCWERAGVAGFSAYEELVAYRRRRGPIAAATAPGCALIAAVIAHEALLLLSGSDTPATLGRALTVDLRSFTVTWEDVSPDSRCRGCGPRKAQGC